MSIETTVENNKVCLHLDGSFDVSQYQEFKKICKANNSPAKYFEIDFKNTVYIDSSALGMLLLLREQTEGDMTKVELINVGDSVFKILEIAQFNKLFRIQKLATDL